MKVNPLNPELTQAWNKGRQAGKNEATQTFYEFLKRKMETLTELEGVGEKTAFKIQMHFLEEIKEKIK